MIRVAAPLPHGLLGVVTVVAIMVGLACALPIPKHSVGNKIVAAHPAGAAEANLAVVSAANPAAIVPADPVAVAEANPAAVAAVDPAAVAVVAADLAPDSAAHLASATHPAA